MGGGRGQVAIEYLFLMGFALLLTLPLVIIYHTQSLRLSEETAAAMVERAAGQIGAAADTVYYLGSPSVRTVTVQLPQNIKSVAFSGQSVIFTMDSSSGDYEHVAWSAANLTGSFTATQGPHVLMFSAMHNSWVNVTER